MTETKTAAEHVNALTKRWLAVAGSDSAVLSALGVWPLLAFLADGADETTRSDLSAALGIAPEEAALAARRLLATLEGSPSVRTALGLWTRNHVRLHQAWLSRLPASVHGELTGNTADDQRYLDAWASGRTGNLIPRLPIAITPQTMLVMASALSVTVDWVQQFGESRADSAGPWADSHGSLAILRRRTSDLSVLRVADTPIGPVTALTVEGDQDVDVHLVLGPADRSAADVLTVGPELVGAPRHPMTRGTDLPLGDAGPGVRVALVESFWSQDILETVTVPFRITARHDLLDHAELFGLQHAASGPEGHFPGVSDFPLYVEKAVQDAIAEFSATGFRAAAVTAIGVFGAALPTRTYEVRNVTVSFDRPFAYYAVHRASGLILVAGWVTEPHAASFQS